MLQPVHLLTLFGVVSTPTVFALLVNCQDYFRASKPVPKTMKAKPKQVKKVRSFQEEMEDDITLLGSSGKLRSCSLREKLRNSLSREDYYKALRNEVLTLIPKQTAARKLFSFSCDVPRSEFISLDGGHLLREDLCSCDDEDDDYTYGY